MKVLFIGRSVAHFSYYDSIIRNLCAAGHRVHLIYDREWSNYDFGRVIRAAVSEMPGLTVGWSQRRQGSFRHYIFGLRELRSFAAYAGRAQQSKYYLKRWQGYLPSPIKGWVNKRIIRTFIASLPVQLVMALIERLVPPANNVTEELKALCPDVVIASPVNMRFSEEVEYIKAAKSLHIPTALPVLSWDNLTTKGLINIKPDLLLAWNDTHQQEAIDIHGISKRDVVICGSPFFDKWFEHHDLNEDRAEFFARLGFADPGRFLVTYLGSSKNIAKDESWLVKELYDQIKSHPDPGLRNAYLLVRPHPANTAIYRQLVGDDLIIWPKDGSLPEELDTQKDFYNSLKHSVCIVSINTSGMIDAVIHDVPCISIITEQYHLTQSQAEHFKHLLDADVLELPVGIEQTVAVIQKLLHGEDQRRTKRSKFVNRFVRPQGINRSAGSVAAQAISELANSRDPLMSTVMGGS